MAVFERVNPLGEGLIRGPARFLAAASTIAFPTTLEDVINTQSSDSSYQPEIQSLSFTGSPTGGTFTLSFNATYTAPIDYNASSSAVQAALNAISSIADSGGVTVTDGPLPTSAVTITFNDNGSQLLIAPTVSGNSLTGGETPAAKITETQAGNGQFDIVPDSGWFELGATRSGAQIAKNNTEDQLDIDQVYGSILAVPNEHEMTVSTQLAEVTLENIQLAWDLAGSITTDLTTPTPERTLGLGAPTSYTQRRLAVLHKKTIGPAAGLIRGAFFRSVTRSATNSQLDYQKSGQMQTLPTQFRAYIDPNITDESMRFGAIIEQEVD